ncbi:MAG: VCBS repeat-containing protein, partial [Nannocystaceae bacterium]
SIVFHPGSLSESTEIEIVPSDEPPPIFGPAYRVRPDIELLVDVEVSYRRALPADPGGVAVAAIRLEDYVSEQGYWVPLPRVSLHEPSGTVVGHDSELSLFYGLLEAGGSPATIGPEPGDGGGSTNPSDETCGDGTAEPGELCYRATPLEMGGGPVDVTLGDFDGDGLLDVATANRDGTFSVRLGDGGGGFGPLLSAAAGAGPTAIGSAAFDANPGDDLVITLAEANEVLVMHSRGDGRFDPVSLPFSGMAPTEVVVTDVGGDGVSDILVANSGSGTVSYFPVMGSPGSEISYGSFPVETPTGLAVGQYSSSSDFNADLLCFGGGIFTVLPGTPEGALSPPAGGEGLGSMELRRAVGGEFGGSPVAGDAAVADFAQGGVHVLLGDGQPGSFISVVFYATGDGAVDVAAGDFDGDMLVDLVVANQEDDTATVLRNLGDGTWGEPANFATGAGPSGIALGDLTGDGIVDIVVATETGNGITVLTSNP